MGTLWMSRAVYPTPNCLHRSIGHIEKLSRKISDEEPKFISLLKRFLLKYEICQNKQITSGNKMNEICPDWAHAQSAQTPDAICDDNLI